MKKILIIQASFYTAISEFLLAGATKKLQDLDFEYEIVTVPGALEIPAVIAMAESSEKYSAYVALGCVIRGETSHYDYVCGESAHGLSKLAIGNKIAIGNGILTVENEAQALERARPDKKDKGGFAANAAVEMLKLRDLFSQN
jgi:6,7-dimethyl-8-ribityllumazine synthase